VKRFRIGVHVVPRRGILDPQGQAVAEALHTLGFGGVETVHVGRHIVVDVGAPQRDAAEELLANPVTEDFEIATVEPL
jgi:phosphoribosylformylglycinamidine synthase